MMQSTMMDRPLGIGMILRHGLQYFGQSEVATYDGAALERASYAAIGARVQRLAAALTRLGIRAGDRVGTFCWNHQAHLEAYFAVPSMGAILHTINVRYSAQQLRFVIANAGDRALIVDASLMKLLADVIPHCPAVEVIIVVGAEGAKPAGRPTLDYEALLADAPAQFDWPEVPETQAAAVCYTSGTTGQPKGVVYSHRSTFLHSLATRAVDTFGVCNRDRILVLPAMFHANAWGMPYSAWMSGADLILPRQFVQAEHIARMVESERPTLTAMVPTLVNDLLQLHARTPVDLSSLRYILVAGSAIPAVMIDRVRSAWNVAVLQGWGMTETSPMCALSHPPRDSDPAEDTYWRAKAGRPVAGVEMRVVDDAGAPLPHDDQSLGEIQVRGPWVTGSYHADSAPQSFSADGWLRTGDVGAIDARGYVRLTDRAKDVIKSGGEWISSVELEGHLIAHPDVVEVAVVGVQHERWQERPLALVRLREHAVVDVAALQEFLAPRVARWWIPEYWAFVPEIPKTSVGKIDKKLLRERHAGNAITVIEAKPLAG